MWKQYIFYYPQAISLMGFLAIFLFGWIQLTHYRKKIQKLYNATPTILSVLLHPRPANIQRALYIGWIFIWILCCIALMSPYQEKSSLFSSNTTSKISIPEEIIFLIDTSASMRVRDGEQQKTRLEEAKSIIEDIVTHLKGETVSLYAFTSELTPVVPSTLDYLFMQLAVRDLHIEQGDVGGTQFFPVFQALQKQLSSLAENKKYSLIVLTDGGDRALDFLEDTEKEKKEELLLKEFPLLENHIGFYIIGIGSVIPKIIPKVEMNGKPVFSGLQSSFLEKWAKKQQGKYEKGDEGSSLQTAQKIIQHIQLKKSVALATAPFFNQKEHTTFIHQYYQIPLGLALLWYGCNLLLISIYRL
jgi:Ca-activated chloride channel family protein